MYLDPRLDHKNSTTSILASIYFTSSNILLQNRDALKENKRNSSLTVWVSAHWLKDVPLNPSHDQLRPRSIEMIIYMSIIEYK